jgi:hypothetical protein
MAESFASPIELAERVARIAHDLGIHTAVIGAYALAVHHYARATRDLDLGTSTQLDDLRRLRTAIEAEGFHCHLETPDEQDDLGGKLTIWVKTDEDGDPMDEVDVVNFFNIHRPRRNPAGEAIRNSREVAEGSALRYPMLADLVALKLDAGGPKDQGDIIELLRANPDADVEAIRATCKKYGLDKIDELIEYARSGRR